MKKLQRLIGEARESCEGRGHVMHRFHHSEDEGRALGVCRVCYKVVAVKTNPLPNEIDIGGEAVALHCGG